MKKHIVFLVLFSLLFGAGCRTFAQHVADIRLSEATPAGPGETSIEQKAADFARPLGSLPWGAGAIAVPLGGFLIAKVLNDLRGRKIRLQQMALAPTDKPITGVLGNAVGVESVVQFLADLSASLFEVGTDGSVVKRGWKAFMYTVLGSAGFANHFSPLSFSRSLKGSAQRPAFPEMGMRVFILSPSPSL